MDKIIIDTDTGHDDVLALFLMFRSKKFDIKAITTVCGNSTIENATRNAFYVRKILKISTPIFSGQEKPLIRDLVKANVHGENGLAGAHLNEIGFNLSANAPEKIIEIAKKYPRKITILTLGPLTNIAKAISVCPDLPSILKEIVIMGGAINVCGNKNRVAEFNMFVDPEAADIVFRSKVKKVLVPLDPCNEIILKETDFDKLNGSDLYLPIKDMMAEFIKGIEKYEGVKGALVYDALAAYYLINKRACKFLPMDILVETKGEHTFGMTVVEKRRVEERNNNINVVDFINKEKFIHDFVKILS